MAIISAPYVFIGTEIVAIIEQVIWPVAWAPVVIPAGKACKQLIINERAAGTWRLSTDAAGTTFFTVTGPLSMEITGSAEQTLFYAQTTAASGTAALTLEMLLVN